MFMSVAYKVNGEEKLNLLIVSDAIPADAKLYQAAHSHVSRTHIGGREAVSSSSQPCEQDAYA